MSLTRRNFMALIGTTFAGVAVIAASKNLAVSPNASPVLGGDNDNWRVDSIGAVSKGAVPITLVNTVSGERIVVEACRRGSGRSPVASSKAFDLFVVNNGGGKAETPRSHTLAARSLAKHLDRKVVKVPETVVTMDARLHKHNELFQTNDDFVVG